MKMWAYLRYWRRNNIPSLSRALVKTAHKSGVVICGEALICVYTRMYTRAVWLVTKQLCTLNCCERNGMWMWGVFCWIKI